MEQDPDRPALLRLLDTISAEVRSTAETVKSQTQVLGDMRSDLAQALYRLGKLEDAKHKPPCETACDHSADIKELKAEVRRIVADRAAQAERRSALWMTLLKGVVTLALSGLVAWLVFGARAALGLK